MSEELADFTEHRFSHDGWERAVFELGNGPAVIIMHEMPGLHPLVLRFARRIADAGMTAVLPSLFGKPGKAVSRGYLAREMLKAICIRREFSVWASGKSSPIVSWLRALAKAKHETCGGRGVGAVGMCFTGGFAIAMMSEPAVIAPVLSQPSLPLAFGPGRQQRAASIDASDEEIQIARDRLKAEQRQMLALRFDGDPFVPPERFDCLRASFGDQVETIELPAQAAAPDAPPPAHSVLTIHLDDSNPDGPTRKVEQKVLSYFENALKEPTTP